MPRKKEYIEEDVIEKAMHVFWKKGYEATSVRDLERKMGINQFSMYASFKNKQGVFLESLKCYKSKVQAELLDTLNCSEKGKDSIKEYFYNFLDFIEDKESYKGCLLTNTINELGDKADKIITSEILNFATNVRGSFVLNLQQNFYNDDAISRQADYLMVSLQGLSVASKMFDKKQLENFIEVTFKNL
jgi:AcrR family transcriptional regulator